MVNLTGSDDLTGSYLSHVGLPSPTQNSEIRPQNLYFPIPQTETLNYQTYSLLHPLNVRVLEFEHLERSIK